MKKGFMKFLSIGLAVVVTVTTILPETVYASTPMIEETVTVSDNGVVSDDADMLQNPDVSEDNDVSADETVSGNNPEDLFGEKGKLNYVYLDERYIETPSTENIIVSFGDEETVLQKGTLVVQDVESGEKLYYSSDMAMDNTIMFEMTYTEEDAGIYEAIAVSVTTEDGTTKYVPFEKTGMDRIYYGVDQEVVVDASQEAMSVETVEEELLPEIEDQIVTVEEEQVQTAIEEEISTAVEEALDEAETTVDEDTVGLEAPLSLIGTYNLGTVGTVGADKGENLVIVLDPGHDSGGHGGTSGYGMTEQDLVLKIAKYCKEELEQYAGVTLYMTRSTSACPFPGGDAGADNAARVAYAASVGADVYISFHLNAASASAHGAEIFYPNSNYNASIGNEGHNLAIKIQRQLVALGLYDRGVKTKNASSYKYADGSVADYYQVIRECKKRGIAAIIIEHAFMSNASDAEFLSKEDNLRKLGVADAAGIVDYYELEELYNFTANKPTTGGLNDAAGTFTAKITGVTPVAGVKKVQFAVWTPTDGQDDLKWYTATANGSGSYSAKISVANHKLQDGKYIVHAYIQDKRGKMHFMGGTSITVTKVEPTVGEMAITVAEDESKAKVTIDEATNLTSLRLAVWSTKGEKDDLKWYTPKNQDDGTWAVSIPISNHKTTGEYNVHVYGANVYEKEKVLATDTFTIEGPVGGVVTSCDINDGAGKFKVKLDGVSAVAGIEEVRFAVWSKSNKSNLYWYTATLQEDGSYTANVNIKKHGYEYGTYQAHAYVTDNNGVEAIFEGSATITVPQPVITATGNATQTKFNLKASDVGYAGGVYGVRFAVWSEEGGQDDLVWYTAGDQGDGVWSVNAKPSKHKTAGDYIANMYIIDCKGIQHKVGTIGFHVDGPEGGEVSSLNMDEAKGKFTAKVDGISAVSGVKEVRFAVWSKSNQSNISWYTATLQEDGSYTANVNIKKHGYEYGTYQIHAYVTDNNGIEHVVKGNATITQPEVTLEVVENATQTKFNLKASDVIYAGGISGVRFAVWSAEGGQDDLVWYTAKDNGEGIWSVNAKPSKHKTAGEYIVHMYITDCKGKLHKVAVTGFSVNGPEGGEVTTLNMDEVKGKFTVKVDGIQTLAGVKEVRIAAWTKSNQSDIYWYTAKLQEDGSYTANVNIKKHKYRYGTYQIQAVVTDKNGIDATFTGSTIIVQPEPVLEITANATQTKFTLQASDVTYGGGVGGVQFAVWSEDGGKDDLVWYTATNKGDGVWGANAKPSKHKAAGDYVVAMYILDSKGGKHASVTGSFHVDGPEIEEVTILNIDEAKGKIAVKVDGIQTLAGVKEVRIAAWTKSDQSDIYWYTAKLQEDGSYTANVNIKKHKYCYGTYQIQVNLTDKNNVNVLKETSATINQPEVSLQITGNDTQTKFTLRASGVEYAGGVSGVQFAVWSEEDGQDDLVWYTAKDQGDGVWSVNAKPSKHKVAGDYIVRVYVLDCKGNKHRSGEDGFYVEGPKMGTVETLNANDATGKFTVKLDGVSAVAGVKEVRFAIWSKNNKSNLRWYTATLQEDGSCTVNVNIKNHGYEYGTYQVHAYVTDKNNVEITSTTTQVLNQPIAVVTATGNATQTQFNLKASNVGYAGGVYGVSFAVWSEKGGQNDLKWYSATNKGEGVWSVNMKPSNHKTAGDYIVHMYIKDKNGGLHHCGTAGFNVEGPVGGTMAVTEKKEADGLFTAQLSGVSSASGISSVRVAVWCASNQSDLIWYKATKLSGDKYQVIVDVRNHQINLGTYKVHAYVTDGNGIEKFMASTSCEILNVTNALHPIMGSSSTTVDQMVAYYNSVTTYPAFYANTDAPTIRQFCQIYLEECNAEGVKAEVAFVQAMKETNFLRYGGDVKINQFNFAGIGATGGGAPGNSFASVRIGVRAQVQHLKAYASDAPLNQACVDPRFQYVTRNVAPYCEWLGQKENPYGKGWATAVKYGYNIVERVANLKKY